MRKQTEQTDRSERVDVTRRAFLRAGSLVAVSATAGSGLHPLACAADGGSRPPVRASRCLWINLVGGPSQLDTWDPKPEAPAEIRGPFGAIATQTPGVFVSSLFPQLATRSNRFALVRSLFHDAAPIHETGLQLLQTGRLNDRTGEQPHFGAVLDWWADAPENAHGASVILPGQVAKTGVNTGRGQTSGFLGPQWQPIVDFDGQAPLVGRATSEDRRRYGMSPLARCCLSARHWLEAGSRCVTVNMFTSLHEQVTWDAHAKGPELPTTIADYQHDLAPQLDQVLAAVLDDFQDRGLLDDTLIVATGELGRAPRMNDRGGRDHWTKCWTCLVAGAGVTGGAVIGQTDPHGAEPIASPVHAGRLPATVFHAFGVPDDAAFQESAKVGRPIRSGEPLVELWS